MRVRTTTTGSFSSPTATQTRSRSPNICTSPFGSWVNYPGTPTGTQTVKTTQDVEIQGFHALKARGDILPLNPFVVSTVTTDRFPVVYSNSRKSKSCAGFPIVTENIGTLGYDLSTYTGWPVMDPLPDSVVQSVVNGAAAESRSAAWDSLTFLAEFKKTKQMLIKAATEVHRYGLRSISDAARDLRRQVPRERKLSKLRELVASRWLEYRYGWLPTLYDAQDMVKSLNHIQQQRGIGRASQTLSDTKTVTLTANSSDDSNFWVFETQEEYIVRGWAMSEFVFQSRMGFDPLVTIYNVIPLSFAFDWLIQAGTWLEAWSPFAPGRTLMTGYSVKTTRVRKATVTITPRDTASSWGIGGSGPTVAFVETSKTYERGPRGVSLPGWNPRLNLVRGLDSVALISQFNTDLLRRIRI